MSKKTLARKRGTVGIIVVLLLGSAVTRLAVGADAVMAEIAKEEPQVEETTKQQETAPQYGDLGPILEALRAREAKVEQQEAKIKERMATLKDVDAKVREKIAQLENAEAQLRSTIALASTAAEDDLARLTAVYESMKPKTAAAVFSEMDPEFAAGFLGRMRPNVAASVMAGMEPQMAYTISAILAGRNAEIPKN